MALKYFRTFFRKMFDNGGVLAAGIVCLYFQRRRYISDVFGPISYGIISVGAIAIGRHIMDLNLLGKPTDASEQTWDRLLKEIAKKTEIMQKERLKREILESLHRMLNRKIEENIPADQTLGKKIDIFSQEFLEECEKEMQLNPEERDLLQQYLKSFEVYLQTSKLEKGEVERSDDSGMEIINKEEIQMFSGVE